jgi:hypothetical protein
MMGNPFFQALDPASAPDAVTPQASPADPAGYGMVTPHGQGPAPYDIQAPMEDLSAVTEAAGRVEGAGIVYPYGPRQAEAAALLDSPQGSGAMDVTAGFAGGGGESWPANPGPAADPDNGGYGGA